MHQLQCLNLNERSNQLIREEQNAVVLYKGDGALVPFAGFELIKKQKPRPKVDLDLETDRIWNLLMGKEASQGVEGTDKEKEKWWEEERKVFRGRTDSFIARMHLIQGTVLLVFASLQIVTYYSVLHIFSPHDNQMSQKFTLCIPFGPFVAFL